MAPIFPGRFLGCDGAGAALGAASESVGSEDGAAGGDGEGFFFPPMTPSPPGFLGLGNSGSCSFCLVGKGAGEMSSWLSDSEAVSSSAVAGSGSGSGLGVGEGFLVCCFPPITPMAFDGFAAGRGGGDSDSLTSFCCFSSSPLGEGFAMFFCCFNLGGVSCRYTAV